MVTSPSGGSKLPNAATTRDGRGALKFYRGARRRRTRKAARTRSGSAAIGDPPAAQLQLAFGGGGPPDEPPLLLPLLKLELLAAEELIAEDCAVVLEVEALEAGELPPDDEDEPLLLAPEDEPPEDEPPELSTVTVMSAQLRLPLRSCTCTNG
jgi:hypothetical protein